MQWISVVIFWGFSFQAFNRSASTNTDTSGSKQTFNERHSRDKIENFLKEVKTKDGINTNQLAKAWEEYTSLMKNEKTLAYKYPKQVRVFKAMHICEMKGMGQQKLAEIKRVWVKIHYNFVFLHLIFSCINDRYI